MVNLVVSWVLWCILVDVSVVTVNCSALTMRLCHYNDYVTVMSQKYKFPELYSCSD